MSEIDITLYLVGYTKSDAESRWPILNEASAKAMANNNPGMKVYSVNAKIDFSTTVEVD